MKVLDLFCGGGGAAEGIKRAIPSAKITGIDIKKQSEYPFTFIRKGINEIEESFVLEFDFLWMSPPCQKHSTATKDKDSHKCFINECRKIFYKTGLPGVIENVMPAPLRPDLVLCGEMFGLKVIRHRKFECFGFLPRQPKHKDHKGVCDRYAQENGLSEYYYVTVAGNGTFPNVVKRWQDAMDIRHITKRKALAQAIPPAYSEYILKEFVSGSEEQERWEF